MSNWHTLSKPLYLRVPYEEKDIVKKEGALFDFDKKLWFVPPGKDPLMFRDYWGYLECPFWRRKTIKNRGARYDSRLKRWYCNPDEFEDYVKYWPKNLQKFVFNERYNIFQYFRESGQSNIYYGWDNERYGNVVIKLYKSDFDNSDESLTFNRELEALLNLGEHPNILSLIDWGIHEETGDMFLVTPKMDVTLSDFEGMSEKEIALSFLEETFDYQNSEDSNKEKIVEECLEEISEEKRKDPWTFLVEDYIPLIEGLKFTYEKGIIHRDIKPSNIFLNYEFENGEIEPRYILGDFGSSKIKHIFSNKDNTNFFCGTEPWSPPRTIEEKKYQETWDVYSIGVLIANEFFNEINRKKNKLECFTYPNDFEDVQRLLNDKVKEIIGKERYQLLENCLSFNPRERTKNISVFLERIKNLI